jgi:hypothetical protein
MQSMPIEWQERMVLCLEQIREAYRDVGQAPGYKVDPVDWNYPEDLGYDQRKALGITREGEEDDDGEGDLGDYYDAAGNVLQGCSVPVPAREPLPHYRRGFVEPGPYTSEVAR